MLVLRRKNTITLTAAVIIFGCTAVFLNPTQVLADRDAYLQEKYFINQLNSRKKKRGVLFGRKKQVNNDPAVQYQRQQQSGRIKVGIHLNRHTCCLDCCIVDISYLLC
jgi:hypothetical protein